MRIVSGNHKGRRIIAPKSLPIRPTTDMAKESLFNILNNQYEFSEISVLDLFSGSGNISYEFASRGVESITAVDSHNSCVNFIKKTASQLDLPIRAVRSDVFKFLNATKTNFDIIFADPPYAFTLDEFSKIHAATFNQNLLAPNGMLIIEHSKQTKLSELSNYNNSKNYGSSVFSFFPA